VTDQAVEETAAKIINVLGLYGGPKGCGAEIETLSSSEAAHSHLDDKAFVLISTCIYSGVAQDCQRGPSARVIISACALMVAGVLQSLWLDHFATSGFSARADTGAGTHQPPGERGSAGRRGDWPAAAFSWQAWKNRRTAHCGEAN